MKTLLMVTAVIALTLSVASPAEAGGFFQSRFVSVNSNCANQARFQQQRVFVQQRQQQVFVRQAFVPQQQHVFQQQVFQQNAFKQRNARVQFVPQNSSRIQINNRFIFDD